MDAIYRQIIKISMWHIKSLCITLYILYLYLLKLVNNLESAPGTHVEGSEIYAHCVKYCAHRVRYTAYYMSYATIYICKSHDLRYAVIYSELWSPL